MSKTALITGVTGQDGAYLSKFLLDKGYQVYGAFRRLSTPNFWRLQALDIFDKIKLVPCDLSDMASLVEAIKISKPDEVYNLAAQSYVAAAFDHPVVTSLVDGISVTMLLEAVRQTSPETRFYQASTSEIFGRTGFIDGMKTVQTSSLKEDSVFSPTSPYATAKLYGYWMTRNYREAYKLFACQGILFNHESPMRGLEFVTRKVTNAVAKIKLGIEKELPLGNIEAIRDWGYAPEYVEGMWRIMQHDTPEDFVLATNEFHSVAELAETAFRAAGLDWKDHVKVDKAFMRPIDTWALRGDYSKANSTLGWKPKTHFKKLVELMVKADLERWKRVLDGEQFPWDAPNYPSEAKIITRAMKD